MKRIIAVLAIALLVPVPVFAAQESFPFLATAVNERVNVRAGQSQNFEKLCQLDKGEEVVVVGKNFSWYKVQLPPRTFVYVSDKYVRLTSSLEGLEGEVTGDRVNVRASARVESTILGQVEKGSHIRIIEKSPGWYKIAPPAQVSGWVAEGLVTFKSRDITAYRPSPPSSPLEKKEEGSPAVEVGKETSEVSQGKQPSFEAVTATSNSRNVSVTGVLRLLPPRHRQQTLGHISIAAADGDTTNVFYELLIRNKPAYFLQGPRAMFDDFVHFTVTIDGTLNADLEKQFLKPVLNVVRIQLVL